MGLSQGRCCSPFSFSQEGSTREAVYVPPAISAAQMSAAVMSAAKMSGAVMSSAVMSTAKMSAQAPKGEPKTKIAKNTAKHQRKCTAWPRNSIANVTATHTLPRVKQYGKLAIRLGTSSLDIQPRGEYISLNEDAKPMWFETKLFVGRMVMRVKHAENAPQTRYFDSNKRLFSCQIEGMFKQRICTNNVYFVVSFPKRIKFPDTAKIALKIHKALKPGLQEDLTSDAPFAMTHFITMVPKLEVRTPEMQDKLGPWRFSGGENLEENSELLLPVSQRKNWRSNQRKRYFRKEDRRKETYFDPAFVYTFDLHTTVVDLVALQLRVAGTTFDLGKYMNHQPICIELRAYDDSGNVTGGLAGFEIHHEDS